MFDKAPEGLEKHQYTPAKARAIVERKKRDARRLRQFKKEQRTWVTEARKRRGETTMKITPDYNATPTQPESKAAYIQVGWLGLSGEVYPIGHTVTEPSYSPLYIQIGTYEQNDKGQWILEQD